MEVNSREYNDINNDTEQYLNPREGVTEYLPTHTPPNTPTPDCYKNTRNKAKDNDINKRGRKAVKNIHRD